MREGGGGEGGVEGAGEREAHMCHGACVEVSGQLLGVGSLLPFWALGIELRLPKLLQQAVLPTQPSC